MGEPRFDKNEWYHGHACSVFDRVSEGYRRTIPQPLPRPHHGTPQVLRVSMGAYHYAIRVLVCPLIHSKERLFYIYHWILLKLSVTETRAYARSRNTIISRVTEFNQTNKVIFWNYEHNIEYVLTFLAFTLYTIGFFDKLKTNFTVKY